MFLGKITNKIINRFEVYHSTNPGTHTLIPNSTTGSGNIRETQFQFTAEYAAGFVPFTQIVCTKSGDGYKTGDTLWFSQENISNAGFGPRLLHRGFRAGFTYVLRNNDLIFDNEDGKCSSFRAYQYVGTLTFNVPHPCYGQGESSHSFFTSSRRIYIII